MPTPLWIMFLTMFAITVGSPILVGLLLFLIPGRKGSMRQEREVTHDRITLEEARTLYAARLAHDGFALEPADGLKASRPRWGNMPNPPSNQVIHVELRFAPEGSGVHVRATAWLKDFVIYDTDESQLIDHTLTRLLEANLDREPPPLCVTHSIMAFCSLVAVLCAITIMILLWLRTTAPGINMAAVFAGAGVACVASIFLAGVAIQQILQRPEELRGEGTVVVTMILALLGIALCIAGLYIHFKEALIQFGQEQFQR